MLKTVAGVGFGAVGGPAAEMPDLGGGLACLLEGDVRVWGRGRVMEGYGMGEADLRWMGIIGGEVQVQMLGLGLWRRWGGLWRLSLRMG